ncbi:MAG TPA: diphosphomevalonate decarboxylase [Polyangiaceae bacterium]|nr:diphosphomevalonate decarboxylase [Polyangiaceae bacterium]
MSGGKTAIARANIALIKYWGKAPGNENLTAVPSLSLTLAALSTRTHVRFDPALDADRVQLGGALAEGRPRARVVSLLDALRARAGRTERAEVVSENDFPTASGLASSASGFAALALAASAALGLELSPAELSSQARAASASAARSVFGGYVELLAGARAAEPVAPPDFLDVAMVIALTTLGPKAIGSTEGMRHTEVTSPYYRAWVASAPSLFAEARRALLARDLETLGASMEQSTLMMHASMLAARPALVYLRDSTLRVMERVRALRSRGIAAFFTMDAGPHVKVLVERAAVSIVAAELGDVPGVERVLVSEPGAGAELVGDSPEA